MASTFETVQQILEKKFSVAPDAVKADSTLESLGLDSLDTIELMFEVEEAFDIRVPQDGAAAQIRSATVQDIVDNIGKLVAMKETPSGSPA